MALDPNEVLIQRTWQSFEPWSYDDAKEINKANIVNLAKCFDEEKGPNSIPMDAKGSRLVALAKKVMKQDAEADKQKVQAPHVTAAAEQIVLGTKQTEERPKRMRALQEQMVESKTKGKVVSLIAGRGAVLGQAHPSKGKGRGRGNTGDAATDAAAASDAGNDDLGLFGQPLQEKPNGDANKRKEEEKPDDSWQFLLIWIAAADGQGACGGWWQWV